MQRQRTLFDLDQANRTLPLVRRIVGDIVRIDQEIRRLHAQAREEAAAGRAERAEELQDRMQDLRFEGRECIAELDAVGCELKDTRTGLIDFRSRLGGREVYLCWKLGEGEIEHWHELDAGFSGRRPIADEAFSGA